jgi:hypothetical protein
LSFFRLNLFADQTQQDQNKANAHGGSRVPTVCINAAGSVDVDAMDSMKKKNPMARSVRTKPVITNLQFLRRMLIVLL